MNLKIVFFSILTFAPFMCNGMEPENLNAALVLACKAGDINALNLLFNSGASVNMVYGQRNETLLHIAAQYNFNSAAFLVEQKATIDAPTIAGCTSLIYSASSGQPDITKLLIDKQANVNHEYAEMHTALSAAIHRIPSILQNTSWAKEMIPRHTQCLYILLENGAQVPTYNGFDHQCIDMDPKLYKNIVTMRSLQQQKNIPQIATILRLFS